MYTKKVLCARTLLGLSLFLNNGLGSNAGPYGVEAVLDARHVPQVVVRKLTSQPTRWHT